MKLYWSPKDAIIATVIASLFIAGIYYVHPGMNFAAYAAAWLVLAAFLYQTGSELSERRRPK